MPDAAGSPLLVARNLRAAYGRVPVLHGVSLHVGRAEIVAVMGRNGAGKTTLASTLAGTLRPSAGEVLLHGRDVTGRSASDVARAGMACVRQDQPLFGELTVEENLGLAGLAGSAEDVLSVFPGVFEGRASQRASTLSGGEQKMLASARCLCSGKPLMLFDEPTEGLQPANVSHLMRHMEAARARGGSVLLIEQHAAAALAIADRYCVLEKGEIVAEGVADAEAAEHVAALLAV